jgi:hypothetical protein
MEIREYSAMQQSLLKGFNTYYNDSVLTHVLMPEAIAVSVGFKFFNVSYGSNPHLLEALIGKSWDNAEEIHPGPRSYDGAYTEMELRFNGCTFQIQSAAEGGNQYILVTPLTLTKKPPVMMVSAAVLWNRPGYAQLKDGRLLVHTPTRDTEIFTDGLPARQMNGGLKNPYLTVELSRPVAVSTGQAVTAEGLKAMMARQREKVARECAKYGELAEAYSAMRTCLAWDTIYEPENEQVCSPVSRLWSMFWGGYVLFDWDTYFSAMMAMVDNKELAYANAIAITREKTEKGFVPNFGSSDDGKSRDRSQPPVGSLAVREIFCKYREEWFVRYLFDDLLEWNRWYAANRRLANGQLCWGSNPYEPPTGKPWETEGVNERLGAALESGLDNSPMYDDVPFNTETHLMELADVGLTGLYIMDCENLAELADIIKRPEAAELRERAELSKNGLEEMWDEGFGMYLNKRTDTGEFYRRISPTHFYALYSDRVTPERVSRMVNEHFYNPQEFYGEFIMPSIARNDPAYPEQNYWRGCIWAPTNYLAYLAIRRHRHVDIAGRACRDFAEKSNDLILKEWRLHGHVHENYNADNGLGCVLVHSDKFYHWGGLLALIALTEAGYADGPEKKL